MSVIIREKREKREKPEDEEWVYKLLTKGADSIIKKRLSKNTE